MLVKLNIDEPLLLPLAFVAFVPPLLYKSPLPLKPSSLTAFCSPFYIIHLM
jgi:hypothetical protein